MTEARITGTLWIVVWQHRALEPKPGEPALRGRAHIVTADPTGRDLFAIAETAVLGMRGAPELDFTIVEVHRCAEVQGTATTSDAAARVN